MSPQTLNLIGYWIRDLKDEEFCAPQEVVGNLPPNVRTKLGEYLDAGATDSLSSQRGYSWCRFFCGIPREQMGSRELTDGQWVWPQGLSHYVCSHGITLPEEFVAHALDRKRPPPHPNPKDRLHAFCGEVSLDYWRDWCSSHPSPDFLERLRRARAEADSRAPRVVEDYIQRRVSEEIASYGLGDERCIFAGCEQKALNGMKLCARHVLREEPDLIAKHCYVITPELMG